MVASPVRAEKSAVNRQLEFSISSSTEELPSLSLGSPKKVPLREGCFRPPTLLEHRIGREEEELVRG